MQIQQCMQVHTPGGHCVDSFYFCGDQIVVHNKATFTYIDDARPVLDNLASKVAAMPPGVDKDVLAEDLSKLSV